MKLSSDWSTDGKPYDAYLMTYPSQTETALSEEDRRWMENVLEEQLGYRLCLQDRDVSPGEGVFSDHHMTKNIDFPYSLLKYY
jgi:hypothetical protein